MQGAASGGTKQAVRAWLHAIDKGNADTFPATLHIDAPLDLAGNTALHVAAAAGHLAGVRRLVSLGSDLDALNTRQRTPLLVAAAHGNAACAMALLEAGALPEAPRHSPLFEACRCGFLDVARGLIAAGADVNFMNVGGYVPLMALPRCPPKVDIEPLLALLVASGADIHRCTDPGAVGDFAQQPNRYRLFLRYGARVSDMDLKLLVHNTALLHVYLEAGGDPDAQTTPRGVTLLGLLVQANDFAGLCMAAPIGNVGASHGASYYDTPLGIAILTSADPSIFQVLLDSPCSQTVYNDALRSALNLHHTTDATLRLLMAKADLGADGIVQYCLEKPRRMALLLNGGYDPNRRTPEGYTALFLAVQRGQSPEVVRLLAPRTTDLLTERHDGRTALDVAVALGHTSIVRALLQAGFASVTTLPTDTVFGHLCTIRFPETTLLYEGWRTDSIAYSELELHYMASLCAVLDAPDWRSHSRLYSPLLQQEVDHIRHSNPHNWTPNTARGVYHVDWGNNDICAALRTHLAPLKGAWNGPVHTIVEPMRGGSIEGHTRYSVVPHGGRVGLATDVVRHSTTVDHPLVAAVTCPHVQLLPTPVIWDPETGRATFESYIVDVLWTRTAVYNALANALSDILPLLNRAATLEASPTPSRLCAPASDVAGVRVALPPSFEAAVLRSFSRRSQPLETHLQVLCSVESLHAPPTPWATPWRRGTGAINEAVRYTALVFYDLVDVEARVELRETFERVNTYPNPEDADEEVFGPEISDKRTQDTGFVTARLGRVVLIPTNATYRLSLRRVDANQNGHCKILTWHLVDAHHGGLLSTAEVYPQQRAWFLEAIQGTRFTALPTDLLELVLLCVGAGFVDNDRMVDTWHATRNDIVRRAMQFA
ncbi:hypothetical protein SDRG_00615 [Saprolegnia diclina VS20]|uniref:DUF4246 domain-containing protein n=1 Tax=Saprolegnia diclina (strain VS20) TaxID=1156394 RepID=T0R454_SAPDV|nr:hypothetical protein SDRG_00615 [Saprolegnia diclina VS20]EQC41751.1 hypothetical protein SDRG_00615 [Saprolegnia diclina VS20]|eukprot:XP_008604320.1 hypothetical protein SDRG_00615 [Saprolegnia diclina VS20]